MLTPVVITEFSPTTAPFATPSWVDISDKVRGVSVSRGRSHELDQFSAGTANYTLDNSDRIFDPNYSAGTYFGNLKPQRRFRTTVITGPVVESADGTRYLISVETDGALNTKVTTADAASSTIVLDDSGGQGWQVGVENDGTLRTDTTASAEANVPVLQDLDGIKWIVSVETDGALTTTTTSIDATGVAEYVSTMFADGWPQDYNPPNDAVVNLTATDGFKILARTPVASVWEQEIRDDLANVTGWWRLGEQRGTAAQDSSGQGNQGIYEGGATFNNRDGLIEGDGGGAIEFEEDQRVVISTDLITDYPFTVEAVFKAPLIDGSFDVRYVARFVTIQSPIDESITLFIDHSAGSNPGKLVGRVVDRAGNQANTRGGVSSSRVDDGVPHHVALVATSASDIVLYVDGVAQSVVTLGSGTPAVVEYDDATLGNAASSFGFERSLFGTLDDVVIYDTALSAATISDHHDAAFAPWDEDSPATRIGRILDEVGWSAADRDIDTGRAQLGPFEGTDSALEALQDVARAEGARSMLYIDGAGKLVFRGRSDFWTDANHHDSNATFGDGAGELAYFHEGFRIEHDDSEIINRARIAPNTGWFQQVDDTTSQTNSGIITHEERILEKRSTYALHAAEYIVARKKDDVDRLEAVTIRPEADAENVYPVLLDADFGYRYTFKRRPQGVGSAISIDVHLEHVSHDITPGSWTTRWQLSPVEADAFRWDSGDGSRFGWGNGKWTY